MGQLKKRKMSVKNIKDILAKQPFFVLICLSAIIHLLIIASTSSVKNLIPTPRELPESEQRETAIEIVLNENVDEEIPLVEEKALDIIEEFEKEEFEEEKEKKKRPMFVDTTETNTADEENNSDADKIGEKGSIARDKKEDSNDLDDGAFSDGEAEILALEKGAFSPENSASNVFVREVLDSEEEVPGEENHDAQESKEPVEEKQEMVEEVVEVGEAEEKELDLEETDETQDEGSKSKHVEPFKREKFVEEYEPEKLREFESEFERIIPEVLEEPNELNDEEEYEESDEEFEIAEKEIKENKSENDSDVESEIEEDTEGDRTDIASLPKREKERILKEIVELYEKEQNEQKTNSGSKPKKRVSMSVNGKSAFKAPAPIFKSKKSNSAMLGEASFNIRKHEYASYYKHIRDKISLFWLLFFGTDQSIKLRTSENRPIIVEFKVRPSGIITDVIIAEDAGNPFLASRTQVSVTNTKLDAFPPVIKEEFIDVRFNFYFF